MKLTTEMGARRRRALPWQFGQERIVLLQLLVDLSSEPRREVYGRAMLRGLAEDRPFPFQGFQSCPEVRDLIGRKATEEVVLEHVVLTEDPVAVQLVEDRGFVPGDVPQAGGNRMRKYK